MEEDEPLPQEDGGDDSPAAAPHLPAAHPGGVSPSQAAQSQKHTPNTPIILGFDLFISNRQ